MASSCANIRRRKSFTIQEDNIIRKHVENSNQNLVEAFKNAAEELSRTYDAVFFRYCSYLKPWTREEDDKILYLANQLNNNWSLIQKHMGYRKSSSIHKRYEILIKTKNQEETEVSYDTIDPFNTFDEQSPLVDERNDYEIYF